MPGRTREDQGQDVAAQAAQADQEIAESRAQATGVSPPAEEPLDQATVATLAETTAKALQRLSGGEINADIPPTASEQGLGPELFGALSAAANFLREVADVVPEAADYQFDPVALGTTNAGLQEMAQIISAAGQDEALMAGIKSPKATTPVGGEQPEEGPSEGPDAEEKADEPKKKDLRELA